MVVLVNIRCLLLVRVVDVTIIDHHSRLVLIAIGNDSWLGVHYRYSYHIWQQCISLLLREVLLLLKNQLVLHESSSIADIGVIRRGSTAHPLNNLLNRRYPICVSISRDLLYTTRLRFAVQCLNLLLLL